MLPYQILASSIHGKIFLRRHTKTINMKYLLQRGMIVQSNSENSSQTERKSIKNTKKKIYIYRKNSANRSQD